MPVRNASRICCASLTTQCSWHRVAMLKEYVGGVRETDRAEWGRPALTYLRELRSVALMKV